MELPAEFLSSLRDVKGFSGEAFIREHLNPGSVTSVRSNPYKSNSEFLSLIFPGIEKSAVPWCSTGFYLSSRPSFTLDPLFHAGCYYVQEASSMFLEQVVKRAFPDHDQGGYRVLDLCAAPGGKTTHLSSLLPESLIVANEVIKTRVGIVADNVTRWGKDNIVVTNNDAADFHRFQGYFDLMVIDAPCSGSGLFRRDPESVKEWSPEHVMLCSKRQQRIIRDSWSALKEDGVLLYSTCSYAVEENENILDWIADNFGVETIEVPGVADWGIVETVSSKHKMTGYRFYPDRLKGEGFFMTGMRKKTNSEENIPAGLRLERTSRREEEAIAPFLTNPEEYSGVRIREEIAAIRKDYFEELSRLMSVLYVKKAGIKLGKVIKDELIPAHELAVNTAVNRFLPALELDYGAALQYLRKKDFFTENAAKGWNVVRFKGYNLGWIKVLQNRINNYYPLSLRILKD